MIEVFFALIKEILWLTTWFMIVLALAAIILIVVLVIVAIYAKVKGENDDGE